MLKVVGGMLLAAAAVAAFPASAHGMSSGKFGLIGGTTQINSERHRGHAVRVGGNFDPLLTEHLQNRSGLLASFAQRARTMMMLIASGAIDFAAGEKINRSALTQLA